ncbi:kinase-like domain-containing protein [Gautieria morchelliformis]|nr:kinase-like domain-containing protein [Gautieria morchelliformis]
MKLVGDLISSLERIKIHNASCEDLHRRCQRLLTALEENSAYMDPDEALETSQTMENMLLTITKRLDDWGHLTLLESFIRRAEIQAAIRSMTNDLRITAEKLQLIIGPELELHLSSAEMAHLDIQDSLQMKGIIRYIAGRPEELKALTEGPFTPSDCQNFMTALQVWIRDDKERSSEERSKLSDALWKLCIWTNISPPLANLGIGITLKQDQPLWKGDYSEVFGGWSGGHSVALTTAKALNHSTKTRLAFEENIEVWRHLRHNHIKPVWGYMRSGGETYTVSPCMKYWDLDDYLTKDPPVDRFTLVMNIAAGLEFLHKQTPPILVGPITPRGIHVSDKGKACIAEYGFFPTILQMAGDGVLLDTPFNGRYFAPELLAHHVEITSASDVYGFAMLCLELMTGLPPFDKIPEEALVTGVRNGIRPERPQTEISQRWLSDEVWYLLEICWFQDPVSRPDMSSVVSTLRLLQRARTGESSIGLTLPPRSKTPEPLLNDPAPSVCIDTRVHYAASGEIISGSLSGLVTKLLSDTAGLSSDPVGNTFFYTFRAFTTPEALLDTLETVFQGNFSRAVSVEARIATCFDLLNFLEAWLRRDRSYVPSSFLAERMKILVPVGSFSAPPTLIDKVGNLTQTIEDWFGPWGSSSSSAITAVEPPIKQFGLGGVSPRSLAHGLTYIQSELYYDILPPDIVQWSQNILSRSGRNGVAVFMTTYKQIAHWVAQAVLETSDLRRRAEIVEFFIHTATECLSLGNYSSTAAIVSTLRSSSISSLVLTWKCICTKARDALLNMDRILDPARNFSAYRRSFETVKKARIPHLGVHLLDIKMLFSLASPTSPLDPNDGLVPFAKYRNLYRHIIQIVMQPSQNAYYEETCEMDLCIPLYDRLRHIIVDDTSLKELEERSEKLIASERQESAFQRLERHLLSQDKRHSFDGQRSRSSEEGADSVSLKPLPLPVKDLSRDIVKLNDHSVAGGGFGDVYLGEGTISGKVERVAMKMLRVGSTEHKVKRAFRREVELWVRVRHQFVLPFYGVTEQHNRLFMISPWAQHGNSLQYLQAYPTANCRKLLWQTSDALKYLHSGTEIPPIVHGDIKAENILISDSGDALLADFGLARLVDKIAALTATTTTFGGSVRFMAPELLLPPNTESDRDGGKEVVRTTRSDVYAFGCLILQIFTGERPFSRLNLEPQVILAIVQGQKPSLRPPGHEAFVRGFDEDLWALANRCWAREPEERPKMRVVCAQLREAMYRIQRISLI